MFKVRADTAAQQRTIRPLYAQHQATPYGGFLDPSWDRSRDIYPGMVCSRTNGENFSLYTGATGQTPFGLSALFVAPSLGIDEVRESGTNLFTVWTGGNDAVFEVLAPAFDTSATWTVPTNGSRVKLGATLAAHAQGPGKLTPILGSGNAAANVSNQAIAELITVVGTSKIIVSLDRSVFAANS